MLRKFVTTMVGVIALLTAATAVGALTAPEETHVQAARDACDRIDQPGRSVTVRREARLCKAELDAVLAPEPPATVPPVNFNGTGLFHVDCAHSHNLNDDPIVFP